jgi:multidrug efflux pump subunit AcrA (membrane-fusion protein)
MKGARTGNPVSGLRRALPRRSSRADAPVDAPKEPRASSIPHKKALILGLSATVVLAAVAWAVGSSIRSPAQVAADTAAPAPSLITVPVELRTLSTEVVVRGTVRFGAPQAVELPASNVKQGSAVVSNPPKSGTELKEGSTAMTVSGRPVFVLRGAAPMHRDLGPGTAGPDVQQLEEALARMGFSVGTADGRYDSSTAAAVTAWYEKEGWTPQGPTDVQAEQLRAARAASAAARDAVLQAEAAVQSAAAAGKATPAEISQARADVVTAQDGVGTASLGVSTAKARVDTTKEVAARARAAIGTASAAGAREVSLARADLELKKAALSAAVDTQADAQRRVDAPPGDTRAIEIEALKAALRQAIEGVAVAQSALDAARGALAAAIAALSDAAAAGPAALAKAQADVALAESDVAAKQAALNTARDAQADAQRRLDQPPPDTRPIEIEALRAALRRAAEAVPVARRDVDAADAALRSIQASNKATLAQARSDSRAAGRDARLANIELVRARGALRAARRQVTVAQARVTVLSGSADTSAQRRIVSAAQEESRRADAEVARLSALSGTQVPADEVLFFSELPLRVDAVNLKRGDSASGPVMTVSNSRLAADSSLSINDAKLVRVGAPVVVEEQDLGIKVTGTVTRVADRPGTDKVDPTRVYFEVTPKDAPLRLVGASVRLTIAVRSTKGEVLAVPLSALTVGADGSSRVQVDRGGERVEYVTVIPGLASNGLVEVRPQGGSLKEGDLVVVGAPGSAPTGSATPPAGGATPPATGTTPDPTTTTGTTPDPTTTSGETPTTEPGAATTTGATP